MAITPMAKVMIVCHRSQVSELLEALQDEGICQILNAEEAAISRDTPELTTLKERPRDIEERVNRLERTISFLREYAEREKRGLSGLLAPRRVIDQRSYFEIIADPNMPKVVDQTEQLQVAMEKTRGEMEHAAGMLEMLRPWAPLQTPVEELGRLRTGISWAGLVPGQHFGEFQRELADVGAALQVVGPAGTRQAVIVVALRENVEQLQKLLRSYEFEIVSFEPMTGTAAELMRGFEQKRDAARRQLEEYRESARELAGNLLPLEILHDHYRNILTRERTRDNVPTTEQAVILEGWCRQHDYGQLEKLVARFDAASMARIEPGPGEEAPVEIENTHRSQPFETITRLYGMPHHTDVDPTPFLAPFFALFFGLCLTDAGYGFVMIAFMWWLLRKIRGNARFVKMMLICSVTTVVAGALTGGWWGDSIQVFVPQLNGFRDRLMWFDPLEKPMYFFYISLILGYLQIIFGVALAFWHKWRSGIRKEAIFDHGTWFVWLNSLTIVGLARAGLLPAFVGTLFALVAIVPAVGIVLFSEREGGWGARIGMGCYNLFSTVFYVGDVLSYVRLMALGMVTAGFGMAINSIVKQVMVLGILGWILGAVVFVGGHVFNIANSCLSAFVHSMRLQFVEFFTKFLRGGGREFAPLRKEYRHIEVAPSATD